MRCLSIYNYKNYEKFNLLFGLFILLTSSLLGTPISYGDDVFENISNSAEVDTYTFTAQAGDVIIIRMTSTNIFVSPQLELYDPMGNLVSSDISSNEARIDATLSSNGTYTILASDQFGDDTGDYFLSLQRTFLPPNATMIAYNSSHQFATTVPTHMEAYTFTAQAGDVIIIRMTSTNIFVSPQLELYDPMGNLVSSDVSSNEARIDATLSSNGTYTILASDQFGDDTGDYFLSLQRTFYPPNFVVMECNSTLEPLTTIPTEMLPYVFLSLQEQE